MTIANKMIGSAALAALAFGTPASAACWSVDAVEAAMVQDFNSMLKDAAQRCDTKGVDLSADYSRFVRDKHAVLAAASDDLRAQFANSLRDQDGTKALSSFTTASLARHASTATAVDCGNVRTVLQAAVIVAPNRAALVDLAMRAGADPELPTEFCGTKFTVAQK